MKSLAVRLILFLSLVGFHLMGQAQDTRVRFETITTPVLVDSLVMELEHQIADRKKKEAQQLPSLAERYRMEVPGAFDSVCWILEKGEPKLKKELLQELAFPSLENLEGKLCHEPRLAQTILKLQADTFFTVDVVQLAGYMRIPGFSEQFEQNILGGDKIERGRQFFWLGIEGKKTKAIEYLGSKILLQEINLDEEYWIMLGFSNYAKQGSAMAKEKAFDYCWKMYDKQIIAEAKFKELKFVYSTSNPANALTEILMSIGDERAIPFARLCLKEDIYRAEALEALARLSDPKIEKEIIELLKDKKGYFDALDAAVSFSVSHQESKLPLLILQYFEDHDYKDNFELSMLANACIDLKKANVPLNYAKGIKSEMLRQKLLKTIEIEGVSMEQLASDLVKNGLISNPISKEELELLKLKTQDMAFPAKLDALLYDQKLIERIELESGIIPFSYENLFNKLFKLAGKKLKPQLVFQQATLDTLSGLYLIQTHVLVNDKIYLFNLANEADFIEMMAVLNFLDQITEDAGINERFLNLGGNENTTTMIFADPQKLDAFLSHYVLPW